MDLVEAFEMAEGLLVEHGLTGWAVQYDGAKRRAGVCRFADRVIGLSVPLTRLHERAEVRDTVLHEIAHALVGPAHGHDAVWRAKARTIGCSATRCIPEGAPRVVGSWVGVCPAGHVKDRHRRPDRVVSCGQCSSRFSAENVYEWTFCGRPAAMHPNYVAELEALRAGRQVRLVPVGGRVRITAHGRFQGREGTVVGLGRTSYHVRVDQGVLRVVFARAVPAA